MKKTVALLCIPVLVLNLFSGFTSTKAAGNLGKGKPYKEMKIALPKYHASLDIGGLFVNAKGKIRISSREWEQSVYGISGNKLKKISDPMVRAAYHAWDYVKDKERDTEFYSNTVNKKGTAGYFTNGTILFKYNKKGKIQKTFKRLKKIGAVYRLKWVSKDTVAVGFQDEMGNGRVCLVDMGKGKITKIYGKKYTWLCGTNGKHIYVLSGSIAKKTERIVKLKAASGKKVSSISTQEIRALAENQKGWDEEQERYEKDNPFSTCYSGGKLYLKYLTGVYTWNERKKGFDTVLDGIGNSNYTTGRYYDTTGQYYFDDFEVAGKKMYVCYYDNIYRYTL